MEPIEITAFQIEIQTPIEIIDPRVTRYAVGKLFSKLYWDTTFNSWVAVSRNTGKKALIGANNVKGVLFDPPAGKRANAPAAAPSASVEAMTQAEQAAEDPNFQSEAQKRRRPLKVL